MMRRHELIRSTQSLGLSVWLDRPTADREAEFLVAVDESRALHAPWVTPPTTAEGFRAYRRRAARRNVETFLVVERSSATMSGVITLSQIFYGPFCNAHCGFYGFRGQTGRGLMTAGLHLVLREAFDRLALHRVEANIQPGNLPSRALVARVGFLCEGYSPSYLWVDGAWRDHERWAIRPECWRPPWAIGQEGESVS